MELPRVKILFENGALGSTAPSEDGVVGFITQGTAVFEKDKDGKDTTEILFALNTPYLITSLADLDDMGITGQEEVVDATATTAKILADKNRHIYKTVKEFYKEAPAGSKMWIMAVATPAAGTTGANEVVGVSMKEMVDKDKPYATKLLEASKYAINLLIVSKATDAASVNSEVIEEKTVSYALDKDVYDAMSNAQLLGKSISDTQFAPFFTIIEGRGYTGVPADLKDLHKGELNRVGVFVGDTKANSKCAAVGLIAGRISASPVQRSIARVKSGAIAADNMYLGAKVAENAKPEMLHNYGYITVRTFVGKAGYYFSDDKLATAITDDYALIPRRRIVDKAYRIAYQTLVNELNDEIAVTDNNTIPAPIVKSIQNKVEAAIENNMTAYGNLGNDSSNPNDTGVVCYIDPNQNVVSSSTLNISLQVKPYGYAKYINVNLGFKTTQA